MSKDTLTVADIIEAVKKLEAANAVNKCELCGREFYVFDHEGRAMTGIRITCDGHEEH